jgi:hypothetical protein
VSTDEVRARVDRRDELAYRIKRAVEGDPDVIRYNEDDWTRIADVLMPMIDGTSETVRFHLDRDVDVTGASGTGHVADGVVWPDGTVTVRWRGERKSTVNWDRLDDAEAVHGHGGATRIVWDDDRPAALRGDQPGADDLGRGVGS